MITCDDQIISGALHYFRVVPEYWADRLDKAVALGLNTIETYIPWNLHEPHQGEFVFEGICDLERFIQLVAERDLALILRPGPYICSEWDNGGFPGWLNGLPGVQVRCMNEVYLNAVTNYFNVLLPKIVPYLSTNDGPVIMVQVENEYGSFGDDHDYLQYIADLFKKHNIDVPYFTSDGSFGSMLSAGNLPSIIPTVNFGTRHEEAFARLKKHNPNAKEFCMEFWDGWFDHWGEKHHHRPVADGGNAFESEFESIIKRGASINLYMYHGGTNFGFTAGANGNFYTDYAPCVTSYDYDCTLSESGDPTQKYWAAQRIIKERTNSQKIKAVEIGKKISIKPVKLTSSWKLENNFNFLATKSGKAVVPPTMEQLGENFGFVHYRTQIKPLMDDSKIRLFDVNDYAQVWVDGQYIGSKYRTDEDKTFPIKACENEQVIDILVENLGRINYGPYVGKDFKGIAGCVCIGLQTQFHWEYNLLPMNNLEKLEYSNFNNEVGPTFYRGEFDLDEVADTFIKRPGCKGFIVVNGFNLGRYWDKGPTNTLYLPGPILKQGKNEIIVFEQEQLLNDTVEFTDVHDLGELEEL